MSIENDVYAVRILDAEEGDDAEDFVFACDETEDTDSHYVDAYKKFVRSAIQVNRGGRLVCGRVRDRVRDEVVGNLMGVTIINATAGKSRSLG